MATKKTAGRAAEAGKTVQVRLPADLLARIEAWEDGQADSPSRSETIRRLVLIALNDRRQKPR